ncbi:DUF3185 domain-containing protein [Terriglobus sp. ADX1]|uniref:DUF3185 domain-containing protein n=1 Tax=Terriglobus sp. ADX1 TaxID=2794063 RepID=UPI002FE5CBC1
MKGLTIVGVVLVLAGIITLVTGGFSFKEKKQDAKLGPIQVSHTEEHSFPIGPVVSGVLIVAGLGLAVAGARSK